MTPKSNKPEKVKKKHVHRYKFRFLCGCLMPNHDMRTPKHTDQENQRLTCYCGKPKP